MALMIAAIIFSLNAVLSVNNTYTACNSTGFYSGPLALALFSTLYKKVLTAFKMDFSLSLDISMPSFSISLPTLSVSRFPLF